MFAESINSSQPGVYSMGRPRKNGRRTPAGHLSRANDALEERESVDQIAQKRAQRYALLGDEGRGVDLADPLQVLGAQGHLTPEEVAAGSAVANMHRALFGRSWPRSIMSDVTGPPDQDPNDPDVKRRQKALESRYERAWAIIGKCGGNAVKVARYVCCAREMPTWAIRGPAVTVDRGKALFPAVRERDRHIYRAMQRDLPALRSALFALAAEGFSAGYVPAKKRRAA